VTYRNPGVEAVDGGACGKTAQTCGETRTTQPEHELELGQKLTMADNNEGSQNSVQRKETGTRKRGNRRRISPERHGRRKNEAKRSTSATEQGLQEEPWLADVRRRTGAWRRDEEAAGADLARCTDK
jgi:hypothetical protein